MPAKRVEVAGMEAQAAPGNHEGTRHPGRLETQNSAACVDRLLHHTSIHNDLALT